MYNANSARRPFAWCLAVLFAVLSGLGWGCASNNAGPPTAAPRAETNTEVLHVLLDRHWRSLKEKGSAANLPEKGYVLKELAKDVYFFSNGVDCTMFIVSQDGVVLIDPLRGSGPQLAKAIREVTPQPVKYIIYSTHEARHIGDAYGFAKGATIIAQRQTAERIQREGGGKIPAPQLTFGADYTLRTDAQSVELHHIGGAVNGDTLVFLPEKKVVFLPDRALPYWVPHLEDGEAMSLRVMVLERLNEMDFTAYVPGHGDRPGTRDDLERTLKFYKDGYRAFRFAVMRVFGANAWEGTRLQIPPKTLQEKQHVLERECYRLLAMKWAGTLKGFRELGPGHCHAWFRQHLPAGDEAAAGHS